MAQLSLLPAVQGASGVLRLFSNATMLVIVAVAILLFVGIWRMPDLGDEWQIYLRLL